MNYKGFIDPEHAGVDLGLLRDMRDIIAALGVFWGRIEVDINEDLAGREHRRCRHKISRIDTNGLPGRRRRGCRACQNGNT